MARFPEALRTAREKAGLGSRELARLTGIPPASISNMETGKKAPTIDIMSRLKAAFSPDTMTTLELYRAIDVIEREGLILDPGVMPIGRMDSEGVSAVIAAPGKVSPGKLITTLPVYSDISCGWGSGVDDRPSHERFPNKMVAGADHAVTVKGDSMKDLGFLPGTYLFIKSQPTADNGQPVIARLDGETFTCKVYRDSGRRRWLEGRSDTFKDRIYLDQHDVEILGVVVAFWGKP